MRRQTEKVLELEKARTGGPGITQANYWVSLLRDGFIVVKVGIVGSMAVLQAVLLESANRIPKMGIPQNKFGKGGVFFEPEK